MPWALFILFCCRHVGNKKLCIISWIWTIFIQYLLPDVMAAATEHHSNSRTPFHSEPYCWSLFCYLYDFSQCFLPNNKPKLLRFGTSYKLLWIGWVVYSKFITQYFSDYLIWFWYILSFSFVFYFSNHTHPSFVAWLSPILVTLCSDDRSDACNIDFIWEYMRYFLFTLTKLAILLYAWILWKQYPILIWCFLVIAYSYEIWLGTIFSDWDTKGRGHITLVFIQAWLVALHQILSQNLKLIALLLMIQGLLVYTLSAHIVMHVFFYIFLLCLCMCVMFLCKKAYVFGSE